MTMRLVRIENMDEVLVTFTDEDGTEGLKIVHPNELHGYTLTPPEPIDPEVIKRVEEWEKKCGPLPKPPAGMFKRDFEPVAIETKSNTVEVDERGFFTIDGNLVPDTETGRMRLQYALMNQERGTMTKVFKVELLIVNHDKLTMQEVAETLENANYPNDCISPQVMEITSREVEWSDEHPLNKRTTQKDAYIRLFSNP
jgi:hypothetical protein